VRGAKSARYGVDELSPLRKGGPRAGAALRADEAGARNQRIQRAGARGRDAGKIVKSAERTLDVFSLFHERRRPLTVMDVARALSWPQSSTSELMHTLLSDGYLNFDRTNRTYFPSIRFGLIGNWICHSVFTDHDASDLLTDLHKTTGQTVILTIRRDIYLEVLNVIQGVKEFRVHTKPGDARLITRTAMGHMLLSSYDDHFIDMLVRRINAYETRPERRVRMSELRPVIEHIRRQGYCYSEHGAVVDGAIVAALVPAASHEDRLVIGVAGPIPLLRKNKERIARVLQQRIVDLVGRLERRTGAAPNGIGAWSS
jgi:DNA-binding IclR family transcriptional regulator